jgi:GAG-pre-integrase domain/Integrase core domain
MTNVKKIPEGKIVTANNEVLVCNQSGDVDVRMCDPEGDMINTARLRKVLYVPGLHANLLSCAALTKSRVEVTFTSDGCHLVDQDDGQLIGYGTKGADGLCALTVDVVHQSRASVAAESSVNLWHARLGHVSKATIRDMVREKKAKGITLNEGEEDVIDCDECCTGKQTRKTFSGRKSTAKKVGDIIHSDVCGPILPSLGGHKYFVSFIDEKSRSGTLALLSKKGNVKEAFKAFKTRFEKENDTVIKRMHSDRGGEYKSLREYLNEEGIILEMTAAYCPESNGIAERFNRSILDKARSMLSHAKLDHEFWGEAVNHANYVRE